MPPLNVIDICDLCTVNPKAPSYLLINKKENLLAIRVKISANAASMTMMMTIMIFSSTSNYLQDLNQSRICTMIIITKK